MTKKEVAELHVFELNGFLNAIRCMIGITPNLYGAVFVEKAGKTLDQIAGKVISDHLGNAKFRTDSEFDFKFIQVLLNKYIYSKLESFESGVVEQLDWNLIEYFGLISTAEAGIVLLGRNIEFWSTPMTKGTME